MADENAHSKTEKLVLSAQLSVASKKNHATVKAAGADRSSTCAKTQCAKALCIVSRSADKTNLSKTAQAGQAEIKTGG